MIVAVAAAFIFWAGNAASAEPSRETTDVAAVWDLAKPGDLVTASQGNDATAFREEDAGFSAHHRVPNPFEDDGDSDLCPRLELCPRLNVEDITEALLEDPGENDYIRRGPGRHVDSGANFGIVELPMAVTRSRESLTPIRQVTVYYDDRGWVVAYLPADEPAAGIWRYDPQDSPDTPGQKINDLDQNLLLLAINEVLAAARKDVSQIADADHDTVGYYHWQYPECNAFVLFSDESSGETADPIRFVVPPTIEHILASASVLITSIPTNDQPTVTAELMVDDSVIVSARQPDRLAVAGFALERTDDASRLYEVTIAVDGGGTAAGAVMLVYTKPSS